MDGFIDIPNFEGLYKINVNGVVINKKGVEKIPQSNSANYPRVELYKHNKRKRLFIHRLVAELFIPNPKNKEQVNHKDGDVTNFSVNNLEWCTASENILHSFNTLNRIPGRLGKVFNSLTLINKCDYLFLNLDSGVYYYGYFDLSFNLGLSHKKVRRLVEQNLLPSIMLV